MPKSVFQKLGIGEAKPTTVMLQLADRLVDEEQVKINVFLVPGQQDTAAEQCKALNTSVERSTRLKPYLGAHTERDKGVKMAGEFSVRFDNAAAKECYEHVVIHKNIWEEQGFKFDDGLDYYGLEMIIYKRLHDLGWLRFGRQPA
ncbi:hypothetical protein V6N11_067922 [Hibiscus sabdariffa]|uniref:Stress-response A/B barrel domain-containing protein n=1 Tax=Hibiscus sabdariffa TaxID=183260 RepID=A0ABR2SS59_9ROSI